MQAPRSEIRELIQAPTTSQQQPGYTVFALKTAAGKEHQVHRLRGEIGLQPCLSVVWSAARRFPPHCSPDCTGHYTPYTQPSSHLGMSSYDAFNFSSDLHTFPPRSLTACNGCARTNPLDCINASLSTLILLTWTLYPNHMLGKWMCSTEGDRSMVLHPKIWENGVA